MALTYGFYNSVEGDRTYDAIQMGQIFDGIITDGVYATFLKAMVVKASDNPSEVIVQPGRCWFNHTWTYIDADYPVTAPAPEVILDRVDALVIDINTENAFRANSLVWVQGSPSSLNPERPTLIKSVTHNQYPLCYVYRKAGTTMIYAADITNAVGTSETPFVTGVLTGINIDDLLSQWDDEFHTWEAATKTSFEAWMVNQQSVYVTWFDSIKDQMEGDLTDFEAWFETIRGIIDEEAATHLQAEIDALSEMLPAGSHIDVSTSEPTLFNRNVTVSDGVHSKTVQFNAVGGATVESFPYIGIIDVSSTDGERIASESLNIPYFGRYSAVLAFWSATVNLVGDESLAGLAVTVRDGNGDVVAVVTLNGSGQGVFTATGPDTYKFIYTYGGQTMEVSLAVTQETTYEVEIHGGFNYQAWLTAGRVSETFTSLDDILEDEPALRQLFLVHDSVDYICDTFTAGSLADVTKIFNCDLAAKWINLSDYALDHFYAVAGIKSIMDTADKYGYGEWALMPQVPKMTSNTAPFGEVSASGNTSGYDPWKAFDGDDATQSYWVYAQSSGWIQYHFVEGIIVKKMIVSLGSGNRFASYTLKGSNDGTNFTDLVSGTNSQTGVLTIEKDIPNDTKYEYLRLDITSNESAVGEIKELQFYAWAPKGNVPVMTSNTAPYGEAFVKDAYSGMAAYMCFDENIGGGVHTSNYNTAVDWYCGYKFVNPIQAKRAYIITTKATSGTSTCTYKIQASNDNSTWVDISSVRTVDITYGQSTYITFDNISIDDFYLYYRVFTNGIGVTLLKFQFYGRELKVSVPTMTSNTAPFGEASGINTHQDFYAWKAFDKNTSTSWLSANNTSTNAWLKYKFAQAIMPYMFSYYGHSAYYSKTYKIQGSNDDTEWDDLYNGTLTSGGATVIGNLTPTKTYSYLRVLCVTPNNSSNFGVGELQFYGLDYSEKEFEVGTTKKWLYDHGVELEGFEVLRQDYGRLTRECSQLLCEQIAKSTTEANTPRFWTEQEIDLTPYSLYRAKVGNKFFNANVNYTNGIYVMPQNESSYLAIIRFATSMLPNNTCVSIESVNQSAHVCLFTSSDANSYLSISELWLE